MDFVSEVSENGRLVEDLDREAERLIGATFGETYRVERLIATGGMGAVYEASHVRLPNKRYALKVLHAAVAANQEIRLRFRREAEIACRLAHPNIVDVLDFNDTPDGCPYLVMELLEGHTLEWQLEQTISQSDLIEVLDQVASGLTAAHAEGVVHRDMKPENIFLISGQEGPRVKVVDFGISKLRDSHTVVTQDSAIMGTVYYMSPEQAEGAISAIDGRTDIFALGVIAYRGLCRKLPFVGSSVPATLYQICQVAPDYSGLPPEVIRVFERALAKDKAERYEDPQHFVTDLRHALAATGASTTGSDNTAMSTGALPNKRSPHDADQVAHQARSPLSPTTLGTAVGERIVEGPARRARWAIAAILAITLVAGLLFVTLMNDPTSPSTVEGFGTRGAKSAKSAKSASIASYPGSGKHSQAAAKDAGPTAPDGHTSPVPRSSATDAGQPDAPRQKLAHRKKTRRHRRRVAPRKRRTRVRQGRRATGKKSPAARKKSPAARKKSPAARKKPHTPGKPLSPARKPRVLGEGLPKL